MKLLTSEEVQKRLCIRRPTLYLWVREGKLHPVRAGRGLLFEEDDVLKLLGRGPRVPVWITKGVLEEAKRTVRRAARTGEAPAFMVEYLDPPGRDFLRARVLSTGPGMEIQVPAPGGEAFERLLEAMKRQDFVFLGHEESVWKATDVRSETSPSGMPYIALDLSRVQGLEEAAERGARIRQAIETMKRGTITGNIVPFRREELYERRPR